MPCRFPDMIAPILARLRLRRLPLLLIALCSLTILAFLPVLGSDFILLDDYAYVKMNPSVLRGLTIPSLADALTRSVVCLWHPLSILSFMVDRSLFGMHPGAFHAMNLFYHVLNGVLLFLLLRQMTGSLWRSAAVAALFAIHPVKVESVAWVAERKDVLSVLFVLLAMLAYVRYCRIRDWWAYAGMHVLLCLSLLAKPMFVTLPFLLLLLDYWPLGRFSGKGHRTLDIRRAATLIAEKIPLAMLCAAVLWYVMTHSSPGAVIQRQPDLHSYPADLRWANGIISYLSYLRMLFWPTSLCLYYPFPASCPVWQVAAALVALLVITTAAILLRRRSPHLLVGWLWYLGTLIPVLGVLTQVSDYALADHYAYFPTVGILLMIVWSIPVTALYHRPRLRGSAIAGFAAILLASAAMTYVQATYWKSTTTVARRALAAGGGNPWAHLLLAKALHGEALYDQSIRAAEQAIAGRPDYRAAYYVKGASLAAQGNADQASQAFAQALAIDPHDDDSTVGLGDLLLAQNRRQEAIDAYRRATEYNPRNTGAFDRLGRELATDGDLAGAVHAYDSALQVNPADCNIHIDLASALLKLGRAEDAVHHCELALAVDPTLVAAHANAALALGRLNRLDEALLHLQRAVELDPNSVPLRQMLQSLQEHMSSCKPAS